MQSNLYDCMGGVVAVLSEIKTEAHSMMNAAIIKNNSMGLELQKCEQSINGTKNYLAVVNRAKNGCNSQKKFRYVLG